MRFLFFAAQYLPTVGGVERYTYNLAHTLAAEGHTCTVVTSALPGLPTEEQNGGVATLRLPALLLMGGRFPVHKPSAGGRALARALKGEHYDLAVINTRFYPLSLWAARICKRAGIPAVVVEHGSAHLNMGSGLLNPCSHAYEHIAMRAVRFYAKDFYTVALRGGEWLRHFNVTARGALYNAVNADDINAAADRGGDARAEYGIAADTPLVVFTGRLIREKGVWELLDAFALLQRKLPQAQLLIAGDGPEREALAAKLPPGARLLGALPFDKNMALLRAGDVFCLPTYNEGFATAVLEGAALGCCIVTTPTGGSDELIENGKSGWLVALDTGEIAARLYACLTDEGFRQKAGEIVSQKVRACFSWQNTAARLLEIATQKQEVLK